MSEGELNKKIDEWIETVNKQKGEMWIPQLGPYPIVLNNPYNWQRIEYVSTDWIRTYANAIADTNPLWWREEYARRTRWGGIIAPPTFTDTIAIAWVKSREPLPEGCRLETLPSGHKRELFGVFRPGDRIRIVAKWLGIEERKSRQPKPYRLLIDSQEMLYINQKNETIALITFRFARLATAEKPTAVGGEFRGISRGRHKFTDEELSAIYREYAEDWRRGANILYWEDVAVGEELKTLVTGPFSSWDSLAMGSAMPGHAGPFHMQWERIGGAGALSQWRDPETNNVIAGGEAHLRDNVGGTGAQGFGWNYQFEGLMGRMLTNWMGDDGFLKVLDIQSRQLPIFGDAYYFKGNVTDKRIEGDEHLVDVNLRMDNQDGLLVSSGTAQVRLLSRT